MLLVVVKNKNISYPKIIVVGLFALLFSSIYFRAFKDAVNGTQIEGRVVDSVSGGRSSFGHTRVVLVGQDYTFESAKTLFNSATGSVVPVMKNDSSYRVGSKNGLIFKSLAWIIAIWFVAIGLLQQKSSIIHKILTKRAESVLIIYTTLILLIGA